MKNLIEQNINSINNFFNESSNDLDVEFILTRVSSTPLDKECVTAPIVIILYKKYINLYEQQQKVKKLYVSYVNCTYLSEKQFNALRG